MCWRCRIRREVGWHERGANHMVTPIFGTKAETLHRLSRVVHTAVVLPLDYFAVSEWRSDRDRVLDRVCAHHWAQAQLIVRSSAQSEDNDGASNAGRYLT